MKQLFHSKYIPVVAIFILAIVFTGYSNNSGKSEPNSDGVKIGVISYSWRSMPGTPQDIIRYCKQAGISSIELMGSVAEEFAGIPATKKKPKNWKELPEEEKKALNLETKERAAKAKEMRLNGSTAEKYRELGKLFREAGIEVHTVKFAPSKWSDEEIDYAFESAKIIGAKAVTNEIGHDACKKLGTFAEKHGMYAVFHNHLQPGEPGFDFEEFLAYSPANMLNLDVGHYFGATGKHPNEVIEKLHDRIYSIHLKDKTGKDGDPPNTNMPFGEGGTPIEDILKLVQKNKWNIYCDIELEYKIPEGSNAVKETAKCVEYCRSLL